MGYTEAVDGEKAALCIVNTCTVTEGADRSSRHQIRQLSRLHKGARIVVTGCLADRLTQELGASDQPMISVLNKVDKCTDTKKLRKLRISFPHTVPISALEKRGFTQLMEAMIKAIESLRKVKKLKIPQSHYSLVSQLMKEGRVISIEYEENDVIMEVEIPTRLEQKVSQFEQ